MRLSRFRVSERQALHFIMVACIIGFVSAFLIAFLRRQTARPAAPKHPLIRWISPRTINTGNSLRSLVAELDDPSLMSLPNPRSFSAALWQHQARLEAQPIQPSNSIAYLDATPPRGLASLLPSTPLPETVRATAKKDEASFAEPLPDETVVSPANSAIQFDQPLDSFRLLRVPALPVVASETALRPTAIRLAIAPDGTVAHAMLDRSCGDENADALAINAVRLVRFTFPIETAPRSLLWGTARILWATKNTRP
jgi:hypothetical protein